MTSPTLFTLFALAAAITPALGQTVTIADAKNHIGETATVCGKVASIQTAPERSGSPTFINLDSAYPKQDFVIVIWEEDRQDFETLPPQGAHVCATGKLGSFKGVPQIVVRFPWQLNR